jgi:hypothetical protein
MAGKPVPAMLERGNVDVNHRLQIKNADGTGSSIFSVTIPLDGSGKTVPWELSGKPNPAIAKYALVPGIDNNGRFFTPDGKKPQSGHLDEDGEARAAAYYTKTGQHLGIFSSSDGADKYASHTHAWKNDGTGKKVFVPSY